MVTMSRQRRERLKMKTKKGWELSLVAITGDCAKGGLGDCNDALSFGPEHYGMVREFIKAQAEDEARVYLDDDGDKEEGRLIASRLHKAMMAL